MSPAQHLIILFSVFLSVIFAKEVAIVSPNGQLDTVEPTGETNDADTQLAGNKNILLGMEGRPKSLGNTSGNKHYPQPQNHKNAACSGHLNARTPRMAQTPHVTAHHSKYGHVHSHVGHGHRHGNARGHSHSHGNVRKYAPPQNHSHMQNAPSPQRPCMTNKHQMKRPDNVAAKGPTETPQHPSIPTQRQHVQQQHENIVGGRASRQGMHVDDEDEGEEASSNSAIKGHRSKAHFPRNEESQDDDADEEIGIHENFDFEKEEEPEVGSTFGVVPVVITKKIVEVTPIVVQARVIQVSPVVSQPNKE